MVEVNAETDFVARNETFQSPVVETVARVALDVGDDVAAINAAPYPGSRTVAEEITHQVATIGENMVLRRAKVLHVGSGVVATYVHGALRPGLGKIGVLVAIEAASELDGLEIRPPGRHARRRHPPRRAGHQQRGPRGAGARTRHPERSGARQRQARSHHRKDGRWPHPQIL